MNAKEFAAMLNGREYTKEVSKAESAQAKAAGLIVAFGASDDNLELRGACYDEVSAYNGAVAKIRLDNLEVANDEEGCPVCLERAGVIKVHVKWCPKDLKASWLITPSVPFEPFDIMEDGELFCRGAVFAVPPPESEGLDLEALDRLLDLHGKLIEHRGIIGQSLPCCESHVDLSAAQLIARRLRAGAESEGRPAYSDVYHAFTPWQKDPRICGLCGKKHGAGAEGGGT